MENIDYKGVDSSAALRPRDPEKPKHGGQRGGSPFAGGIQLSDALSPGDHGPRGAAPACGFALPSSSEFSLTLAATMSH